MITRIVKLKFQEQYISKFKHFANEIESTIKSHEGCVSLELLQDTSDLSIFFTYSKWNSEDDLNNYRKSDFFRNIWPQTKEWFSAKPEAWSVNSIAKENEQY